MSSSSFVVASLGFSMYSVIFPSGSDGKEYACNAGDLGLIPGSGRFPGAGNGKSLHLASILAWKIP